MSTKKIQLCIICIIVLSIAMLFILKSPFQPGWDFRNNLWGPAHLMLNHLSPYRVDVLFDNSNAVWLPMAIGVWFPLGYFPLQQASNIWLLINFIALVLVIVFSAGNIKISPLSFGLLVLLFALFPSTLSLLVLGQISLIICLILLIVARFDEQMHPLFTGFLLAFALSKPQLSFLFIFSYLICLFKKRRKRDVFLLMLYTGAGVILTCLPLFFFYPHWIPDFTHNLNINQNWLQPTLYSLLFGQINPRNIFFRAIFLLIGLITTLILSLKLPQRNALLWSLALTTVFSPYTWSWDFVLLFPILTYTFSSQKYRLRKLILTGGYILCLFVFFGMKLNGIISDELYWWVPLFLILISFVSTTDFKFLQPLFPGRR